MSDVRKRSAPEAAGVSSLMDGISEGIFKDASYMSKDMVMKDRKDNSVGSMVETFQVGCIEDEITSRLLPGNDR
jgi:hypothetical protein